MYKPRANKEEIFSSIIEMLSLQKEDELISIIQSASVDKSIFTYEEFIPSSHFSFALPRMDVIPLINFDKIYYGRLVLKISMKDYKSKFNNIDQIREKIKNILEKLIDTDPRKDCVVEISPLPRNIGAHKPNAVVLDYYSNRLEYIENFLDTSVFKEQAQRIINNLKYYKDYATAISAARSTLETFMKVVLKIDKQKIGMGDLTNQFIQELITQRLNLCNEKQEGEELLKQFLNNKFQGVTDFRHEKGMDHGPDISFIAPIQHDARLVVESAISIMSYSIEILEANKRR